MTGVRFSMPYSESETFIEGHGYVDDYGRVWIVRESLGDTLLVSNDTEYHLAVVSDDVATIRSNDGFVRIYKDKEVKEIWHTNRQEENA